MQYLNHGVSRQAKAQEAGVAVLGELVLTLKLALAVALSFRPQPLFGLSRPKLNPSSCQPLLWLFMHVMLVSAVWLWAAQMLINARRRSIRARLREIT